MRGALLVLKKELIEYTKDRKTMFFTLALPIILYPLLFGMIAKMGQREHRQVQSSQTRIALIDESELIKPLLQRNTEEFKLVGVPEDPKQAIKEDQLEMMVTLNASATRDLAEHRTVNVEVLYNRVETSGRAGMKRLEKTLEDFDKEIIASRLHELNLSEGFAAPTKITSSQVGGHEMVLAKLVGTLLPYIMMLMLFAGSMQLGVYVTAGERERGTLVTLLATGLPRHEIIWGKLLYVFLMGIVGSIINIASMIFSMAFLRTGSEEVAVELATAGVSQEAVAQASAGLGAVTDPVAITLTLLLMIPLGLLFSTLIILVGVQAKNTQEAGTAMMPVLLPIIFLALFSMSPGIEKMGFLQYVPIVNVSLAIRKLFAAQANTVEYLIAFIMTVGLAALLTYISTKFLNRESAIFKST